jgi:hypothetical protein
MGYVKMFYRKGSDNDSDALSIREDLANFTEENIIDNPVLKIKLKIMILGFTNSRVYV